MQNRLQIEIAPRLQQAEPTPGAFFVFRANTHGLLGREKACIYIGKVDAAGNDNPFAIVLVAFG